jgi:NAD(P)-dependent dehydrogenase (short-subunit alcohol dehydrogenase family)
MSHRRALVTGGASGIGLAVVERLLDAGVRVAAVDLRPVPVEHHNLLCLEADITDGEQVDACFERVVEHFEGLDLLVSNAGMGIHERLDEGDPDKWQRVVETNLVGAMRCVRAFVPLLERDTGPDGPRDVVIVSSVADQKPYSYGGAYAASKAGLSAMAETLRLELLPQVRVTTVRPGMVDTSFFEHSVHASSPTPQEVGFTAVPAGEVAEAIFFALTRPQSVAINELVIRPADQPF